MSGTSQDRQRETTTDLSGKLRAAEQRIKELEAKVRHHEDRADRAERWLYKIWVEVEQKFFVYTLRNAIDRSFWGLRGAVKQVVLVQSRTNPKSYPQGIDSWLVRW
jgi:hypothetical protein